MRLKQGVKQLKLTVKRKVAAIAQRYYIKKRGNEEHRNWEHKLRRFEPLLRDIRDTYAKYNWFPYLRSRIYLDYNGTEPSKSRIVVEWDSLFKRERVHLFPNVVIRTVEYYQKVAVGLDSEELAVLYIGNERFQFDPFVKESKTVLVSKIKKLIDSGRARQSRVIDEYLDAGISI